MTEADIWRTIDDYATTAALAREAGYDGVEIMGSEGYLINEFTAPRTNDRTDAWGGSLENRLRLAVETMRKRCAPRSGATSSIVFRVSSIDLVQGGLTAEEIVAEAQGRRGGRRRHHQPGHRLARGARADHRAEGAARGLGVRGAAAEGGGAASPSSPPTASTRPRWRRRSWPRGDADLVSMARPMLADPEFANKAREGRADEINVCIACNQACLDFIFSKRVATCLVNPKAGREIEFDVRRRRRRGSASRWWAPGLRAWRAPSRRPSAGMP